MTTYWVFHSVQALCGCVVQSVIHSCKYVANMILVKEDSEQEESFEGRGDRGQLDL